MTFWPPQCAWVEKVLEKKDKDLMSRLRFLRKAAEGELAFIRMTFPEYTIHDINHKDEVCRLLGEIIHDDVKKKLSAYELYLLVGATYLHDIGMADIPSLFDKDKFKKWKLSEGKNIPQEEQRKEFIRYYHHERSYEHVVPKFKDFYIENEFIAHIMMTIAKGHRNLSDLYYLEVYNRQLIINNNEVDMAAMAYYLHIADASDLKYE